MKKTDKYWEKFGDMDPYYWVTTQKKYHKEIMNAEKLKSFFSEGKEYLEKLFQIIRKHMSSDFAPRRSLDFGCGVGRVLLPLAEKCAYVVGADVAKTMLNRADMHCREAGFDNTELVQSGDLLSSVNGSFDFIHSIYVFQHIPCRRGCKIFRLLLEKLNPGGVAVIHFTYDNDLSAFRRIIDLAKTRIPCVSEVVNLLHLRSPNVPMMAMHNYSLNRLNRIIHEFNAEHCYVRLTQDGPFRGIMMFIQRTPPDSGFIDLSPIP